MKGYPMQNTSVLIFAELFYLTILANKILIHSFFFICFKNNQLSKLSVSYVLALSMQRSWDNREDPAWKNAARLYFHCFIKGVQLGSVIGVAITTPIFLFRNRGKPFNFERLMKYQVYSVLGGSVIGLGMCSAKVISWENRPQKFQDRAYRIYYNEGQNRTDKFTYIAMGLASPVGLLTGGLFPMIAFGSYGVVAALIAHVATKQNKQQQKV